MNAAKTFLLDALERVADDGDIRQDELDAAIPNPLDLNLVERVAWQQLAQWVDDADIRQTDGCYAKLKGKRMRGQLAALSDSSNGS